ncbi:MAG: STM3941 family protein, partial [Clostridia bacterium]
MEHENLKKIKFSRAYTPLFLMLSLFLLGLSIYCVFYPVGLTLEKPVALTFYIAGGIGALYFAFSSFNYIFQLISPKNAIILSPEGFADFSFCGTGAGFIEWSNIKTVKIATTKHGKLFGLTLVNPDLVLTDTSKTVAKAIKRNIDAKLPEIIIRQDDLSINLNELLELFDDY